MNEIQKQSVGGSLLGHGNITRISLKDKRNQKSATDLVHIYRSMHHLRSVLPVKKPTPSFRIPAPSPGVCSQPKSDFISYNIQNIAQTYQRLQPIVDALLRFYAIKQACSKCKATSKNTTKLIKTPAPSVDRDSRRVIPLVEQFIPAIFQDRVAQTKQLYSDRCEACRPKPLPLQVRKSLCKLGLAAEIEQLLVDLYNANCCLPNTDAAFNKLVSDDRFINLIQEEEQKLIIGRIHTVSQQEEGDENLTLNSDSLKKNMDLLKLIGQLFHETRNPSTRHTRFSKEILPFKAVDLIFKQDGGLGGLVPASLGASLTAAYTTKQPQPSQTLVQSLQSQEKNDRKIRVSRSSRIPIFTNQLVQQQSQSEISKQEDDFDTAPVDLVKVNSQTAQGRKRPKIRRTLSTVSTPRQANLSIKMVPKIEAATQPTSPLKENQTPLKFTRKSRQATNLKSHTIVSPATSIQFKSKLKKAPKPMKIKQDKKPKFYPKTSESKTHVNVRKGLPEATREQPVEHTERLSRMSRLSFNNMLAGLASSGRKDSNYQLDPNFFSTFKVQRKLKKANLWKLMQGSDQSNSKLVPHSQTQPNTRKEDESTPLSRNRANLNSDSTRQQPYFPRPKFKKQNSTKAGTKYKGDEAAASQVRSRFVQQPKLLECDLGLTLQQNRELLLEECQRLKKVLQQIDPNQSCSREQIETYLQILKTKQSKSTARLQPDVLSQPLRSQKQFDAYLKQMQADYKTRELKFGKEHSYFSNVFRFCHIKKDYPDFEKLEQQKEVDLKQLDNDSKWEAQQEQEMCLKKMLKKQGILFYQLIRSYKTVQQNLLQKERR